MQEPDIRPVQVATGMTRGLTFALSFAVFTAGSVFAFARRESAVSLVGIPVAYAVLVLVVLPLLWRGRHATPEEHRRYAPMRVNWKVIAGGLAVFAFCVGVSHLITREAAPADRPFLRMAWLVVFLFGGVWDGFAMQGIHSLRARQLRTLASLALYSTVAALVWVRGYPREAESFGLLMFMATSNAFRGLVAVDPSVAAKA